MELLNNKKLELLRKVRFNDVKLIKEWTKY